ncbi:MAG: hypothetical protein PHU25_16485 [Deltaproteobacteria bacterium]|nr:hypothetical protein [Deltaproteobacteria bacterium]
MTHEHRLASVIMVAALTLGPAACNNPPPPPPPPVPAALPVAVAPPVAPPLAPPPVAAPAPSPAQPVAPPAVAPPAPAEKPPVKEPTKEPSATPAQPTGIVLPGMAGLPKATGENAIRGFWALVDRDKPAAAVALMDPALKGGAQGAAAWKANLASIDSVQVGRVSPWSAEKLPDGVERYKVSLNVKCKADDPANPPPIPHYGWSNGNNIRWMTVKQAVPVARISAIDTGP